MSIRTRAVTTLLAVAAVLAGTLATVSPASAALPCRDPGSKIDCPLPDLPPAAPTGLRTTLYMQASVTLSWSDNADDETAYTVRRVANGATTTTNLPANTQRFVDVSAPAGVVVEYFVTAKRCRIGSACRTSVAAHRSVFTHPRPSDATIMGELYGYPSVYDYPDGLRFKGWAIDWDTSAPVTVSVLQDGVVIDTFVADTPYLLGDEFPFGEAFPGYGDDHGFARFVHKQPGTHEVCLFAHNTAGGGHSTLNMCTTYSA